MDEDGNYICAGCCQPSNDEWGYVRQYLSGTVNGEHYEGAYYHDQHAFELGIPEELMA